MKTLARASRKLETRRAARDRSRTGVRAGCSRKLLKLSGNFSCYFKRAGTNTPVTQTTVLEPERRRSSPETLSILTSRILLGLGLSSISVFLARLFPFRPSSPFSSCLSSSVSFVGTFRARKCKTPRLLALVTRRLRGEGAISTRSADEDAMRVLQTPLASFLFSHPYSRASQLRCLAPSPCLVLSTTVSLESTQNLLSTRVYFHYSTRLPPPSPGSSLPVLPPLPAVSIPRWPPL